MSLTKNLNLLLGAVALLGSKQFFLITSVKPGILSSTVWLELLSLENTQHSTSITVCYNIDTGVAHTEPKEIYNIKNILTVEEFILASVAKAVTPVPPKKPQPTSINATSHPSMAFILPVRRIASSVASPQIIKTYKSVLQKVFGIDTDKYDFKGVYEKNASASVIINCSKQQFADFIIERNNAGLQNGIQELSPRSLV